MYDLAALGSTLKSGRGIEKMAPDRRRVYDFAAVASTLNSGREFETWRRIVSGG